MQPRRPAFIHEPMPERSGPDSIAPSYAAVFETEGGKRVFEDMCRIADSPSIDHNQIDPNQAIWIVARQALIKQIKGLIERGRK